MRFPRVIPRRAFLTRMAAWAGAGAILPNVFPRVEAAGAGAGATLDRTKVQSFRPHIGTVFRIGPAAAPRSVTLIKVTSSRTTPGPGREAAQPTPAFSLIFREAQGPNLSQDTYRAEHPELGVFQLFLVPIGSKQADVRYQAIFA